MWWIMLEKKDVVQKSFRIHKQNDIWLGLLARKLDRTQNELVNHAIKMLLEDNKRWFFEDFIESHFRECTGDRDKPLRRRIGDAEIEVIPFACNPEGRFTRLNFSYFENGFEKEATSTTTKKIDFAPGYDNRLLCNIADELMTVYERYPQIMDDFNPGSFIEE